MDLLEREQYFGQLTQLWRAAATGHGCTVLVSGEAGIGKTALVEQFVHQHCQAARRLCGACDALFTPRPLGPLHDMAAEVQGAWATLLQRETPRSVLFSAFLNDLQQGGPTVVVIEDIHWADEATLDLITFLGRRIAHLPTLVLLTYRDDALARDHPLRAVLGDLPSGAAARLRIPLLSEQAVRHLARHALRPQRSLEQLYAVTGGNPFFVTEVLASNTAAIPPTVRDAVLARVARLSPPAQALLELVSVVPTRTERWLLDTMQEEVPLALEDGFSSGMLSVDLTTVAFRHELARLAVESTLSPLRRQTLHAQLLERLLAHGAEPSQAARLVHHAAGANDEAVIARYAPLAARHAASQGAHREAAAHYATALAHAGALSAEQRATLQEALAEECYCLGRLEEAEQARLAALHIWRQGERVEKVGHTLRWLSRLTWTLGKQDAARVYGIEAVRVLECLPARAELAMAYANQAQLAMNADEDVEAIRWREQAIALAEQIGDGPTLVHALTTVGATHLTRGRQHGWGLLEQGLRLALEQGWEEPAARAYTSLACGAIGARDYPRAQGYLEAGMAYCAERDLDFWGTYLQAYQAQAYFEQGAWEEATAEATQVLNHDLPSGEWDFSVKLVLGWVRLRRGDPGSEPPLEEAHRLALIAPEHKFIVALAVVRAEAAWLQGDLERCQAEARVGYDQALARGDRWALGQLSSWIWRAGGPTSVPEPIAEPYARQLAGDWQGAASWWAAVGCPFEQALALAEGDADAQRQALALFAQLDARPVAARVRQRMRQQGRRGIPRGQRPSTRANQAGLTSREVEVLLLLAEGLSNAQIASRLSTSVKTVVHHVSAILAKLQVRSRTQAVVAATTMGMLSPVSPK